MKEIRYTIPEFLDMQRTGERIDKLGYKAKKQIKKAIAIGIGTTLFLVNNPSMVFAAVDLTEIDVLGMTFLTIIRRIAYWLVLIGAIAELIKCVRQGGSKEDIMQVIMRYVLIYAALFLIPKIFDLITTTLS